MPLKVKEEEEMREGALLLNLNSARFFPTSGSPCTNSFKNGTVAEAGRYGLKADLLNTARE